MRVEKSVVVVSFPKDFDPRVEYISDGGALRLGRLRITVRDIECNPFTMTPEWAEFVKRADIPEMVTECAWDAAFKAFHSEFTKQMILSKLRVSVED